MRQPPRRLPLATAVAVLGLLGGCSAGTSPPADAGGVEKMNAYIGCFNAVEQPIHESFVRYTGWMQDAKAGPTGKEAAMRGPGSVLSHRVDACGSPMLAALAMTPAEPALDDAARTYQQTFVALHALIEQTERYYSREDFLRDGRAGVRSQHAPLMQAYAAFFAAGAALDTALETREDARHRAQLQAVEADEGRSLTYYQLRILGDGKQLTRLLGQDAPELVAARTRLADFQALLKQAQDDKVGQGNAMWRHLERAADALARDAGRRIARVQAGTPLTRSERLLMQQGGGSRMSNPQGSADAVMASYNDLVDASNRMAR